MCSILFSVGFTSLLYTVSLSGLKIYSQTKPLYALFKNLIKQSASCIVVQIFKNFIHLQCPFLITMV